jgi:hypothetical protein
MIKMHALAALALFSVAGDALAASQDINLTASVAGSCTISNSESPSALTQALSVSSDGYVSTTPVLVSFPVACNKPASLSLMTVNKGLVGPADATNYQNRIEYGATVSGGVFPDINIIATPLAAPQMPVTSAGPVQGTLNVSIVPVSNAKPLAAGDYADTLRLTISPLQ